MKPKTNPPKTLQGQYAGFVSRLVAYVIDLLVVIATIIIVGITADLILRFFRLSEIIDTLLTSGNALGDALRFLTYLGSIAFISFSYFVLIWTFTAGQSVGKVIMGVRIVPIDGTKITIWRSIVRYVAFLFSAILLFLGLLWVLISDNRQGWHDKVARTYVIYDWPAREDDGVIGRLQDNLRYIKRGRRPSRDRSSAKKVGDGESEAAATVKETKSAQG